jgi:hypothetical protein
MPEVIPDFIIEDSWWEGKPESGKKSRGSTFAVCLMWRNVLSLRSR